MYIHSGMPNRSQIGAGIIFRSRNVANVKVGRNLEKQKWRNNAFGGEQYKIREFEKKEMKTR